MSYLKLSDTARWDIRRLYKFLAQFDLMAAKRGKNAIVAGLEYLQTNPNGGAPMEGRPNARKFIVPFGASGYLVFHKRYEEININLVTRILHQKEWYDAQTIGLDEEKKYH